MGEVSGLRHECGVFGIFGYPEAANLTYLGLYALQHRGQESAGITVWNGEELIAHKGMGLVADVFNEDRISRLRGNSAIGHVRYSTSGSSQLRNAQPISGRAGPHGPVALAHNGNLINAVQLRDELEAQGSIINSTSDTEVILHLIARSTADTFEEAVADALRQLQGAYSIVILTEDRMVAARDPKGFRPLSLGKIDGAWTVASESCAFGIIDAQYERDIEPGEMLVIDRTGVRSSRPFPPDVPKQCVFEYIYFSRPDSIIYGRDVDRVRYELGEELAREGPAEADVVIPVPDSSVYAALGYAHESGIPYDMGLIRNHYVGRTFIEPAQSIRDFGAKIKYSPVARSLKGKRVVVVDDSIVRGTTVRKIVKMIRGAGAAEVHFRVSSPPMTHPCFYGVDTPSRGELIAASHSCEEMRVHFRVDSLYYLSMEGLFKACGGTPGTFCSACFTGTYPLPFENGLTKLSTEHRRPVQLDIYEPHPTQPDV